MNKVTVRTIPERLMPDERNQFVQTDIQGEEWADYDSWGIEQACKLITLGYPVHLEGMAEEVKGWPQVCDGRDRFDSMVMVYGRALRIAKSSVQAGTIKEHDTPANWIKWAEGKGYSVAHLMPADAGAGKGKAGADTSPSGDEIPGKMPQTNIGKLAIKAAWQIECDTSKRATAKQVIEKLQAWTETEPELAETIPHGVRWTTT